MRRSRLTVAAGALAAGSLFAAGLGLGAAGTSALKLSAKLNTAQEVPKPKGAVGASGTFTATLTGRKLTWTLTFRGLTGPALAAHVHSGARGRAGAVLVPLCGPCKPRTRKTTTVSAKAALALKGAGTYVNVHTKRNPAGEIRGQITGGSASSKTTTGTTGGGTTGTTTEGCYYC